MQRLVKIAAHHRGQAEVVRDQADVMFVVPLFG
jgi:hypothetical protein